MSTDFFKNEYKLLSFTRINNMQFLAEAQVAVKTG